MNSLNVIILDRFGFPSDGCNANFSFTLVINYEKQNKTDNPDDLAKQIKSGKIEIPEHFKGKKISYNGGAS